MLEQRSRDAEIDLFYGDETQVAAEGYVPYGWQFKGENVSVACSKGARINCFGLLTRHNQFVHAITAQTITADFVIEQIDLLSFEINKHTVIVLDNARVHSCKKMKAMQKIWARRNLFIFFLPPYCPHLNIIERLWKEMKARWISVQDYKEDESLFYAVNLILNAIGKNLLIHFKPFNINLN